MLGAWPVFKFITGLLFSFLLCMRCFQTVKLFIAYQLAFIAAAVVAFGSRKIVSPYIDLVQILVSGGFIWSCFENRKLIKLMVLVWPVLHISLLVMNRLNQTESDILFEPRCEKTGLRGFRPGPTQIGLYSYRRWLEI